MNNSVNMLSPFVLYCQKVIPLAFDESMSYYECLCALYSYLKDTVVPAVNNNAEALEEVQKKMIELKDYVDNYFDNLDIQTEINNKLDEMAESGELADIIAQYLQVASVLGYDTIADMSASENLVDGSIARVLGELTYDDGKGHYYRVRQVRSSDVVDGVNIVALDVSETLIAELIPDYYISTINTQIEGINEAIEDLQTPPYKVVMYGDSYARGSTGTTMIDSWCVRVATMMGLSSSDYYADGVSGGAFYNGTINTGWNTFVANIPSADKPLVSKVIIGAGANDFVIPSATGNISTNIASLVSSAKNNFPNAKIYVCLIGYKNLSDATYAQVRAGFLNNILRGYASCVNYGAIFAGNIGYILHDSNLISATDGTHPTENGYQALSRAIYNFVEGGNSFIQPIYSGVTITPESANTTISTAINVSMCDEVTTIQIPEFTVTFTNAVNCSNVGLISIGTFDNPSCVRPNGTTTLLATGTALLTYNNGTQENVEVDLRIGLNNACYLVFNKQYLSIKSLRTRGMQGVIPTGTM